MSDPIKVKGLAELEKFLRELPPKLEANVMRGALRAGANVVRDRAKAGVPVKTGLLRSSIRAGSRIDRATGKVAGYVRAGGRGKGKTAFYAHFLEYGTAAHQIAVGTGKRGLVFGGVVRKKVDHPGIRPRPFMRPALDTGAREAVVAMGNYMKRRLQSKYALDTADITVEIES